MLGVRVPDVRVEVGRPPATLTGDGGRTPLVAEPQGFGGPDAALSRIPGRAALLAARLPPDAESPPPHSGSRTSPGADMMRVKGCGMDWRDEAACVDVDPEVFFPVGTTGPALDQIERAKAVCAGCPVIAACLAWALETNQQAGVWGGMSEDERRSVRRNRRRRTKPR
jgi:WhiB family transcriptional regulator, redox-sensing transcriptional regulator